MSSCDLQCFNSQRIYSTRICFITWEVTFKNFKDEILWIAGQLWKPQKITNLKISTTVLPSADTGDCSNGVTVTSKDLLDVPPTSSKFTCTNPVSSEPVYCASTKLATTPVAINY